MALTGYSDLINFDLKLKENTIKKSENTAVSFLKDINLLIREKSNEATNFRLKLDHYKEPFRLILEEFNELISEPNEFADEYEQKSNIEAAVENINSQFINISAQLKSINQLVNKLEELHSRCNYMKYACSRTTQEIKELEEKMTIEEKSLFDSKERMKNKAFTYRFYDIKYLNLKRPNLEEESIVNNLLSLHELTAIYLDQYELGVYDYNLTYKRAIEVIKKFEVIIIRAQNHFRLTYKKIAHGILLNKKIAFAKELADFNNLKTRINRINFWIEFRDSFQHLGSLPPRREPDDQQTQQFMSLDSSGQYIKMKYCKKIDKYINLNLLDKAFAVVNKILKEYPNDPFLYNSKGCIFHCWKRLDEALECFNVAIMIHLCEGFLLNRAQVYVDLERWQEAINDLKKAIEQGSTKEETLKNLISQYEEKL